MGKSITFIKIKKIKSRGAEMEKLLDILSQIRSDIDYENENALVDDGILDSFDIVSIVSELSMEYDIDISIDDMTAENFNSAEAMLEMIARIQDED
jgi:acyl carrier protein